MSYNIYKTIYYVFRWFSIRTQSQLNLNQKTLIINNFESFFKMFSFGMQYDC